MDDKNMELKKSVNQNTQISTPNTEYDYLMALLGSSRDHIYFKDLQSRFIKVSEAFARRHSLTADQMIGKSDFDLFGPVHAQQAFDDEMEIMRTLEPMIDKEEFEDNQDGTTTWVSTSKLPLLNRNGILIGTFGISRDVTRRKRAENIREALFEISEAVYTTPDMFDLYKTIHEVVGRLMPAKNFYISLYDEANQMLTFPYFVDEYDDPQPPKKIGRGLTEYVLRIGKAALVDAQTDLDLRFKGEVDLVGAPQALWLGVPLTIGERTIGVIVIQDYENVKAFGEIEVQILTFVAKQIALVIERRKNSEHIQNYAAELSKMNNTKDKFFSIISHNLHEPLNRLLSFSDVLLEDFANQPEHEKEFFIEKLQSSVKDLISLTDNLLTWAKIQGKGVRIDFQKVNLLDLVKSVFVSHHRTAKNKEILLELECNSEISIYADLKMTETVLRNLIANSIKYTKPGGLVTIRCSENDNDVTIIIQDTGIGMSKELIERLFKINSQVFGDVTQQEKGSGLGLVICKEFVEKNHGKISVESEIKKGTVVSLTFRSAKGIL